MSRLMHISRKKRLIFIVLITLIGLLYVIAGTVLYVTDSNTFKGGTTIAGIPVENLSQEQATDAIRNSLAATTVTINADEATLTTTATNLGYDINPEALTNLLQSQKRRYAILPLGYPSTFSAPLTHDLHMLRQALATIPLPDGVSAPVNATVTPTPDGIVLTDEKDGTAIDPATVATPLEKALQSGEQKVVINTSLVLLPPFVTKAALQEQLPGIRTILAQSYSLSDANTTVALDSTAIASRLTLLADHQLGITKANAQSIITAGAASFQTIAIPEIVYHYTSGKTPRIIQQGVAEKRITNTDALADELRTSIAAQTAFAGHVTISETPVAQRVFSIDDANKKVLTYQIETWGTVNGSVQQFREYAAETLLSELGWSRAGVAFEEVDNGGTFNLVLVEGDELAKRYPAACDAYYSCRVGRYVMINDSRWQEATPVWTKSLRDYQHLVINHEVGHLLGLGHSFCSNPGDPAPVMQQQSIELRQCTFNQWPLQSEIDAL